MIHACTPCQNELNPIQMLDRFVRIGENNGSYSLSIYSRFFDALQFSDRNMSTRIEMFFTGLGLLALFSKVRTNKMMALVSVHWAVNR